MTSRVTQYRNRLKKENPAKYAKYVEDQKMRSKARRDKIKEELKKRKPDQSVIEKREREKAQGRERQRKYAERKKTTTLLTEDPKKLQVKMRWPLTRTKLDKQRAYWREAKQRERSKATPQKKFWTKRKDRERKRQKRETERQKRSEKGGKTTDVSAVFPSKKTEWNVTTQVRTSLPKSPRRFAQVVKNLITNSSPMKRNAMEDFGTTPEKVRLSRVVPKTGKGKTALKTIAQHLLKKASMIAVSRQTGLNRKTIQQLKRTQGKRKNFENPKKRLVQKFYFREDVSRIMPQKRFALKCGPGYLLQVSIKAAHAQFTAEFPTIKVSVSGFAKWRPRNVRLLKNNHRDFCLCVYCVNVRYKMLVLGRLSTDERKKLTSEKDIPEILLCTKSDTNRFHRAECIHSTCKKCGDQEKTIRRYFKFVAETQDIVWNHWEKTIDPTTGKQRRMLKTKVSSGQELIDELVEDIVRPCVGTSFVQHLFTGNWQMMQYNNAIKSLEEGELITVMDFGKNRTVNYQDEIKSAFFGAQQITVHPIVAHYKKNGEVIRDALIFISNDITHDYHAVHHFDRLADNHIEDKLGHKPHMKTVFSDGCSSQYKSRGPFADLSLATVEVNRNFFGSEHGKCEGDGEMGVLNRAVDRAVLGRQLIINSAEDMFIWCTENLTLECPLTQRHFFLVDTKEINRDRPYTAAKTLPQTRKIQQVRNVPGQPYHLKTRNLSCFCGSCLGKGLKQCSNREYVDNYTERLVKLAGTTSVSVEMNPRLEDPAADFEDQVEASLDLLVAATDDAVISDSEEVVNHADETRSFHSGPRETLASIPPSVGTYLGVKHGSDTYPAVVVDTPPGFDAPPRGTFYGHYYQPCGEDLWRMNETTYLLLQSDIISNLATPNIAQKGARICYKFVF